MFPSGKYVIGRITNTAVNAATVIPFKDINGTAHVFAAGTRLIVRNISVNNRATAKDLTIFQDTDGGADSDAGEEVFSVSFAGQDNAQQVFDALPTKRINTAATNFFYALASTTGAVDIIVVGEVINS